MFFQDVTMKVISFSQQGPRAICILSANGVISNVTLRQPDSSGGTLTYEVWSFTHNMHKYLVMKLFHIQRSLIGPMCFLFYTYYFVSRDALSCCPCLVPLCQLKIVEHEVGQVGWVFLLPAQMVVLSVVELPAYWWRQVLFRCCYLPFIRIWCLWSTYYSK